MRTSYWTKRTLSESNKILDTSIFGTNRILQRLYLRSANYMVDKITNMYLKIQNASPTETITRNFVYTYAGYMEMLQDIGERLDDLGVKTNNTLSKNLVDLYKDNCKFIDEQLEPSGIHISAQHLDKRAETASKRIWAADGKSWSERVWGDTAKLKVKLADTIPTMMTSGQGVMQMTYELQKDFSVTFSQAKKIATTELTHIYSISAQEQFKEAGFEQWEWSTSEDGKVCEECSAMDGKRFPILDTVHLPPAHPFAGALFSLCWITCWIMQIIINNIFGELLYERNMEGYTTV